MRGLTIPLDVPNTGSGCVPYALAALTGKSIWKFLPSNYNLYHGARVWEMINKAQPYLRFNRITLPTLQPLSCVSLRSRGVAMVTNTYFCMPDPVDGTYIGRGTGVLVVHALAFADDMVADFAVLHKQHCRFADWNVVELFTVEERCSRHR